MVMNIELVKQADQKHGGHFAPSRGDEQWKHPLADQLNNLLCLRCDLPDSPYGSDLFDVLYRVATFEEIPYHHKPL
jgi:hypothetical protein